MRRGSYVPLRAFFYALLWLTALSELGDTGYRLHHTNTSAGFYDPIVVELLVTAALTLLWIPCTFLTHSSAGTIGRGSRSGRGAGTGAGAGSPHGPRHAETAGNLILWTMWLVGAAIATNKWPNRTAVGRGSEGSVLLSIVALAWIAFGFLTLAQAFVMMEYAAARVLHGGAFSGPGSRSAEGAGAVAGASGGADTGVSPDTNTATNTGVNPGADTGVNPGANTGVNIGSNTGVNPNTNTDANADVSSGANAGASNPGANTDADTDLETGTEAGVTDPGVLGAGIVHEGPAKPVGPGTSTAF